MTREEFKKHIRNLFYSSKTVEKYLEQAYADIDKIFDEHVLEMKAKDEEIERLNCRAYHAEGYISDLHNHPKDKKFYDAKARSIVAMLFWMMKRQKAIYIKSFNELGINNHNTSFYKGAYENSKMRFKQAYAMLKDNA